MIGAIIILSIACLGLMIAAGALYARSEKTQTQLIEAYSKIPELRERAAREEVRADAAEKMLKQMQQEQARIDAATTRRQQEDAQQAETRFRLLANELLSAHTEQLRLRNETGLNQLLTPLKDDIERFRRQVTDFYGKEAAERFSLQEKIKELIEANRSIGLEARELSNALRGNSKIQGDWGEMVLERILEDSGLREGEEYEIQKQRDDAGRVLKDDTGHQLRPDVVVKYPGGRVMVIDSKVSLKAFVEYVNSTGDSERERFGKLHLTSMLKHITELAEKKYQDYVGRQRLDFVMMFVPNENAYSTAMMLDPGLWQRAYEKRVLMVSPTQLVASLKIVYQLWTQDRQTRNAIEIAERSGAMYDKFVGFVSDMEKIERSLQTTNAAYESAMKKLRDGTGSLIVRAEKLRELGVKASKRLPG
ncbi:MAG: DNA recombination protein RmuC [Firmicutes bacterium]|nr:DNA recombination protein RmuC [Bacillota bacterium]MCM1401943.1 DNA recombination protein RmuC [Bacteroides sp.]MCM1477850.1 DNA recombination protein RmuC [Bacteroides sp.]